jgi:hypothetical protein
MYNFCTLFDSAYLTRGLAMYESLTQYCENFNLYIFAFDDTCVEILKILALPKVTVISLQEFEDKELLSVKSQRSKAEYCWTCTPSTIHFVFENYDVEMCTYLDADLYFYASPKVLLEEIGSNSVMIVEHRFTLNYAWRNKYGKYCVQFMLFKNNEQGRNVLKIWRNQCIDWCFAYLEEGKYGDQKYLDDWHMKFTGIHDLQHLGGGIAPWNIQQYQLYRVNDKLFSREDQTGKTFEAVFYHMHYLKYFSNGTLDMGPYCLPKYVLALVYYPYILHLETIKKKVASIDSSFDPHGSNALTFKDCRLLGRYIKHYLQRNVINLSDIKEDLWQNS